MIHFSKGRYTFRNNDALTKGGYTFQIMIHLRLREIHFSNNDTHLPKGDTLFQMEIHFSNNDTLTKGRYTFRIMIHLPIRDDALFQ